VSTESKSYFEAQRSRSRSSWRSGRDHSQMPQKARTSCAGAREGASQGASTCSGWEDWNDAFQQLKQPIQCHRKIWRKRHGKPQFSVHEVGRLPAFTVVRRTSSPVERSGRLVSISNGTADSFPGSPSPLATTTARHRPIRVAFPATHKWDAISGTEQHIRSQLDQTGGRSGVIETRNGAISSPVVEPVTEVRDLLACHQRDARRW